MLFANYEGLRFACGNHIGNLLFAVKEAFHLRADLDVFEHIRTDTTSLLAAEMIVVVFLPPKASSMKTLQ